MIADTFYCSIRFLRCLDKREILIVALKLKVIDDFCEFFDPECILIFF